MKKIVAIGIKESDMSLVTLMSERYGWDISSYGNDRDYFDETIYEGASAVISGDSNTLVTDEYFSFLEKLGISVFVAKMTGVGHIDLEAAKRHHVHVANVQGYSPNAIAELAVGMALSMNRDLQAIGYRSVSGDFRLNQPYFKEIRDCTVGIVGVGRIGLVSAQIFHAFGSRVLGCDPFVNPAAEGILEYTDKETILKESDILVMHAPYIPNENYHWIDAEALKLMKKDAFVINVARGQLVDLAAINQAIKENRLGGYAADVLENEATIFQAEVKEITDPVIAEAIRLYPRILITPHIGAYTGRAREAMMDIAVQEAVDLIEKGSCTYQLA